MIDLSFITELARRQQSDYRQTTSDVHQVALQTLFPVLQSTSGPALSQRAVAATNPLSNGVDQLIQCGNYHRHAGDFLNRTKFRRNRTVFTEQHLTSLERSFQRQKYLSTKERSVLAAKLGLSQVQVKTWYQNRRMKWKKQVPFILWLGCFRALIAAGVELRDRASQAWVALECHDAYILHESTVNATFNTPCDCDLLGGYQ